MSLKIISRFFKYNLIKEVTHQSKSIKWFATLLNYFGLVISFSHKTDFQMDGYQIKFKYGKEMVIILTENCEFKTVIEISEKIKSHI